MIRGAAVLPLLWAVSTTLLVDYVNGFLGVNWGTMASHPIPPDIVVRMLKDNNITQVKLFDADSTYVMPLNRSGIDVMVAIPNQDLQKFSDDYKNCKEWVKENITAYVKQGVSIKYVAVGNEPFLKSYNGSFTQLTYPTLQNIQKALSEAGYGNQIKATVPLNADVYESSNTKPSGGDFRHDIRDLMHKIVKFLKQNNSPFLVNIYPFISLYQNPNFPFEFAFLDGNGKPIMDNGITYTNAFDANFDTLVTSLKKAGVPDLPIMVGEIGWPTDGNAFGNVSLAKKFYHGLFKKLAANKGTPLRPGPMKTYLFSLFDEDQKSIEPGFFERHWGIFAYDGKPKFAVDFTGNGQNKMPIGAKGVQYQDSQWCVLDNNVTDMGKVSYIIQYTCSNADCTSITPGSSCSYLSERNRASYAFNIYFQEQDQDVRACDFNGMASIVNKDPSTNNCKFPIEIVSDTDNAPSLALSFMTWLSISVGLLLSFLTFM
ncbi:hypothetical protein ACFE04_018783 [Oxalis oulophora]